MCLAMTIHMLISWCLVLKPYQLLPSIKQMGSFVNTLGFCCPFTPAAAMGFLLAGRRLPALCREPHVSWGVAYGKESTAISLSLKVFLALAVC